MQTLKIIKSCKNYDKGDIVEVDNNEAFGLLDSKCAVLYKETRAMDLKSPKKSKNWKVK